MAATGSKLDDGIPWRHHFGNELAQVVNLLTLALGAML
jgi:hypothetical protein